MFRAIDLKEGYFGLLGWRQEYDPELSISAQLTLSESGQYYQDIHPLLTLANVRTIAPDFSLIEYPEWDADKDFKKDIVVSHQNKLYKSKIGSKGKDPSTEEAEWFFYDPFSEWLINKTKASNLNALQSIYTEKVADKTAKNILQQVTLFDGAGRLKETIHNRGKVVGFEFVPIRTNGATIKIERIGLQFKGVGTIKLYLMHSSREDPVKEIEIARTKSSGMEWFKQTDLYMPYSSMDTDVGGSWYLCYRQDELPDGVEAINKDRDWSKAPCSTCNDSSGYKLWSKYLEVYPFRNEDNEGEFSLFDVEDNLYTYDQNYGINIQLSVECDFTDIFLDNKRSFQTVVGLQMASDMLQEFAYNPSYRISREIQSFNKNELLYELNGTETSYSHSISYKLRKAIEAMKIDMRKMSRVCLQCNNGGIKYRTV